MKKINNKSKYIVTGVKGLAYVTKWFLVGYGLGSVYIDIRDIKK